MQIMAANFEEYINLLPEDRKEPITKLRQTLIDNLPEGFEETQGAYGLGYCVPFSLYPAGYHCDPTKPLYFINIMSQKNYIALYHMGIYGSKELLDWFTSEYPKHSKQKLDMGKGCIRFKKMGQIPYTLIGELAKKITPQRWVEVYGNLLEKR
ncbi:MAG: DUF1801 domain-containing protein [Ignavibacteriae bacterium]|nr:DUF1801 domain-containing protein [Ignavibacteriota bacterium]